jgi:hypothetical protein
MINVKRQYRDVALRKIADQCFAYSRRHSYFIFALELSELQSGAGFIATWMRYRSRVFSVVNLQTVFAFMTRMVCVLSWECSEEDVERTILWNQC